MKFWTFYGERWAAKTQHLSMMQEGAYHRLCTWVLIHEKPLPSNRRDVLRVARAANACQQAATLSVLDEFFKLQPDGYHQKTADEILQWWHAGGAARNAKYVDGSRARVSALRERRTVYVHALQAIGVKVPSSIGITAAKALCAEHGVTVPEDALRVTGNGKKHIVGNGVSSNLEIKALPAAARNAVTDPPRNGLEDEDPDKPGPYSRALKAMEKAGLAGVYPAHPTLSWLVDAGLTPRAFELGAREAVLRGKGYAWALAMMRGRIEDAAKGANGHGANGSPRPQNGHTSDFFEGLDPVMTAEAVEALRKRLHDPDLDPWELPPRSESERDDPSKSTT